VEYANQVFLNACVLLDGNDCSNSDPLLQPRSFGTAKRGTRVRRSLLLCTDFGQELSCNSIQTAESHRLSEQRIEVTGSCLLINLNTLMSR
jgi:hypothetical protein